MTYTQSTVYYFWVVTPEGVIRKRMTQLQAKIARRAGVEIHADSVAVVTSTENVELPF